MATTGFKSRRVEGHHGKRYECGTWLDTAGKVGRFFHAMKLAQLALACPQCGSEEVFYSCKPECCFNHVCSKCYTTFELATTKVGELSSALGPLPPDLDPTGPTAPCARCGEHRLFAILDDGYPSGQLVCVSCKAILNLVVSAIAPG